MSSVTMELPRSGSAMKALTCALVLSLLSPAQVAAQGYQPLDRVEGWLIERRLDDAQNPLCRASIPGLGTWFSARVRLDRAGNVVVPPGLDRPDATALPAVREALQLCRTTILYF